MKPRSRSNKSSTRPRITRRSRGSHSTVGLSAQSRPLRSVGGSTRAPGTPCQGYPNTSVSGESSAPPRAVTATASNRRWTRPITLGYSTAPAPTAQIKEEDADSRPTLNWDFVSYAVSDQKVCTSYEKPSSSQSATPPDQRDIHTSWIDSYGRMVTKTITTTVTTTIATTELLRPGEVGYEDSVRRRKLQTEANQAHDRPEQLSEKAMEGSKTVHEKFHQGHHKSAQPAVPVSSKVTP